MSPTDEALRAPVVYIVVVTEILVAVFGFVSEVRLGLRVPVPVVAPSSGTGAGVSGGPGSEARPGNNRELAPRCYSCCSRSWTRSDRISSLFDKAAGWSGLIRCRGGGGLFPGHCEGSLDGVSCAGAGQDILCMGGKSHACCVSTCHAV